jgi:putative FmdB family regulatory protein
VPVYEYECAACGEVLERACRISERRKRPPKCPRCHKLTRLVLSATSFVLKGSGWYATDYAKTGKPT